MIMILLLVPHRKVVVQIFADTWKEFSAYIFRVKRRIINDDDDDDDEDDDEGSRFFRNVTFLLHCKACIQINGDLQFWQYL
jgi:hypothetical protein